MTEFNPNNVGVANGSFFALPYKLSESEVVLLSVPWDVTVSYGRGTSAGPQSIIDASTQVDLFDERVENCWKTKIATIDIDQEMEELNESCAEIAMKVIEALEGGEDEKNLQEQIEEVNNGSEQLNDYVYAQSMNYLDMGKIVGVVGGEHSVPLGLIKAVADTYDKIGILHIDAHADLREAYEGFTYSHASIMYNVLQEIPQVVSIAQVGIRDYCNDESELIKEEDKLHLFSDIDINKAMYNGDNWNSICDRIISTLPENIYVSFDIDGLTPDNCPSTGTPVPGGLTYSQADYLLYKLASSEKKIVGFDLCEVAPSGSDEWDANVGARILYKLSVFSAFSHK